MTTTIDPLFEPATVEDPHGHYADLRESDPVHQISGTNAFLVTRMELIHQVVADTATYSSTSTEFLNVGDDGSASLLDIFGNEGGLEPMANALATADPPDHGRQRKVMTPLFNSASMARREAEFRALIDGALDQLLPTRRIEWMRDIAEPLPMVMVARLLGLSDDAAPTLKAHGYAGVELIGGFVPADRRPALLTDLAEINPVLEAYMAARGATTHDTSTVIGTCAKAVEDGTLTEDEVMVILGTLVAAGGESTTSLLGTGVRLLAERPALQERLRGDPTLIPAFVEEALRIDPPFRGHYRRATADTMLGDTAIPAGSRVVLVWPAANRDPSAFDRPDEIDIDRPNPRHHVGFGWGIHLCLGAPLARIEARVTFEQLLARTASIAIADDDGLEHHRSLMIRRLVELPLRVDPAI